MQLLLIIQVQQFHFGCFLIKSYETSSKGMFTQIKVMFVGVIANFFDTLGVGSFAASLIAQIAPLHS